VLPDRRRALLRWHQRLLLQHCGLLHLLPAWRVLPRVLPPGLSVRVLCAGVRRVRHLRPRVVQRRRLLRRVRLPLQALRRALLREALLRTGTSVRRLLRRLLRALLRRAVRQRVLRCVRRRRLLRQLLSMRRARAALLQGQPLPLL